MGVLGTSSDGDDRMEPKFKTKISVGLPAKPKKIPGPKFNPLKNPMPGTIKQQQNTFVCTLFAELRSQGTTDSLLKSSYPKKYMPNFGTQINPGIENFKLKKTLLTTPSLEIPSTPLGTKKWLP